ncbi:iron ABC transporter permease [Endozoicomonas sp. Mp262]|uniref:FecCD family ABC transporter permease n=1 Tax=Endozoicomonas sp. Mp262 TaxID=2919499 RepID=UPI0021E0BA25
MSEAVLAATSHNSGLFYLKKVRKNVLLIAGLSLLTTFSFLTDISIGSSSFTLADVIRTILQPESANGLLSVIVWDIRLPIALIALLIGAILALAGAQMQTILNNPLADPFTLGISSAASFGAALAIVTGISLIPFAGAYAVTGNAFVFSLIASFAIYGFTQIRGVTVETMILVGIALMFTFNALLALLQYGASETQLQQVIFWMMGSLQRTSWNKIAVCTALLVVCLPYCLQKAWMLMALRMGDERARTMGVNVKRLRIQMLIVISLLASVSVAFVGAIGFIGLVAPHLARMMVGEDQRFFLPVAALNGALILSLTSIISKSIVDGVIYPISVITSLIGIPFFISLILASRRKNWS